MAAWSGRIVRVRTTSPARGSDRPRTRYLPPQHGAWAFLGLPVLLALPVTPPSPLLLALAVAWVAAYPASYAALGLVRARRPERFRRPLLVWSLLALAAALVLVWARPWLLLVGVGYLLLFTVNLAHARRNDERALLNDAVFVLECALMVVVTWAVGAGGRSWTPPPLDAVPTQVWVLAVTCALVLAGSTLHVKSLVRERRDPRFARASRVLALAGLPMAAGLATWWGIPSGLWLLLPFVLMAGRSMAAGRLASARPARIGLVELGCFVAAVLAAVLASA